jgi:hypothetical protein
MAARTGNPKQLPGYLAQIEAHPAAALFPMLSDVDLADLTRDIAANELVDQISTFESGEIVQLLDGRNRVAAILRIEDQGRREELLSQAWSHRQRFPRKGERFDAVAFVVSKNIKRRHLTGEQKRELIAQLLKTDPARSDRATAALARVSDKTVGAVRSELEATAEIPQLNKRIGADGKARGRKPAKAVTAANAEIPHKPRPRFDFSVLLAGPASLVGAAAEARRASVLEGLVKLLRSDLGGTLRDVVMLLRDEQQGIDSLSTYMRIELADDFLAALGIPREDFFVTATGEGYGDEPPDENRETATASEEVMH